VNHEPRTLLAAAAAVLAGLGLLVAQPPVGLWATTFLAPPLLLTAVAAEADRAADGRARPFRWGLLAGIVAYAPMLTWLIAPAGAIAWVLLVVIQAAFLGALAWLLLPVVHSPWVIAVAPVLWTGMDALRGSFPLGGFSWGSIPYAHVDGSWLLPVARLVGGRGITVLTVLIGTLVFAAALRVHAGARASGSTGLAAVRTGLPHAQPLFLGLAGALLVSVMATIEAPPETGETLDVLAVQGNDMEGTFQGDGREEDAAITAKMLALTEQAVAEGGRADLTVWPESSIDRDAFAPVGEDLLPLVETAAATTGGDLIVGVNRVGERPRTFQNSAVSLSAEGQPVDAYVKRHLVPFGEYVPLRALIGDLPPLRQIPNDGVPGEGPAALDVAGARVAVAICFETLFPELVRENVLAGGEDAGIILATTNDASFGRSAEPAQHLAQSRLRAVETGRWVVHAALSGASAFVSPDGDLHQVTDLFEQTTIRRQVPLVSGRTPFLTIGDVVGRTARVLSLVWIAVVLAGRWSSRRRPTSAGDQT
jgi:apolipoprotein N-acyltransferase